MQGSRTVYLIYIYRRSSEHIKIKIDHRHKWQVQVANELQKPLNEMEDVLTENYNTKINNKIKVLVYSRQECKNKIDKVQKFCY